MKLEVVFYDGSEQIVNCESFEFRCNQVADWLKCNIENSCEPVIFRQIATIKYISCN